MSLPDALKTVETTPFPLPTFLNEWFTEPETQALTQALNQSTQTGSTSGSEHETEPSSNRVGPPAPVKKITKRKSRASKRSQTTFIVADPENFRQMVQQVTGIRFEPGVGSGQQVVKPDTGRPVLVNRVPVGCLLPTLDTSAFLLDHHQEVVGPTLGSGGPGDGLNRFGSAGFGAEPGRVGFEFDGLGGFPTLESWKVM